MNLKRYIYDNGFSKRYYICSECGSKALKVEPTGGFSPPEYFCMECNSIVHAPRWEDIIEPQIEEEVATDAWISEKELKITIWQEN